jgi:hypothetical protein
VSVTLDRAGGVYVGYTGARGTAFLPLLETSLRCISSCLAFRFRSSVASSSLFCKIQHRNPIDRGSHTLEMISCILSS